MTDNASFHLCFSWHLAKEQLSATIASDDDKDSRTIDMGFLLELGSESSSSRIDGVCNWVTFVRVEMFPNWRSKQINERNLKSDGKQRSAPARRFVAFYPISTPWPTDTLLRLVLCDSAYNEAEVIGKIIRFQMNFICGDRRVLGSANFIGI